MMKRDSFLKKIKQKIMQQDPSAKVLLFGSRNRNEATVGSDWDILVLSKEDEEISQLERKIGNVLYDLELETGQVINPLVYSEKEWYRKYYVTPFFENVMNESTKL